MDFFIQERERQLVREYTLEAEATNREQQRDGLSSGIWNWGKCTTNETSPSKSVLLTPPSVSYIEPIPLRRLSYRFYRNLLRANVEREKGVLYEKRKEQNIIDGIATKSGCKWKNMRIFNFFVHDLPSRISTAFWLLNCAWLSFIFNASNRFSLFYLTFFTLFCILI